MPGAPAATPTRPFGLADAGVAAIVNLLWGLNIIAAKLTVVVAGPFTAGAIRLVLVTLCCLPWLRPVPRRTAELLVFGAINGGLFLSLFCFALKVSSNVGALAIAGQLSVPIALLLGVVFLKERLSWARGAGIALAFAGVAVLVFDPRVFQELPGLLIMTAAAASWAVSTLLQRRLAGVSALTLYAWTGLCGAALLLPASLWLEPGHLAAAGELDWTAWAGFGFSVLGATLGGQGGLAWLLGRHPISSILPLTLAALVVGVIASAMVFHSTITLPMIIGGALALAGTVLVTLFIPKVP